MDIEISYIVSSLMQTQYHDKATIGKEVRFWLDRHFNSSSEVNITRKQMFEAGLWCEINESYERSFNNEHFGEKIHQAWADFCFKNPEAHGFLEDPALI